MNMDIIKTIENEIMPERPLNIEVGDTVRVHYKIIEGNRERVQVYEGVIIAINNKGIKKTFTVRRVTYDIGVERIFPFYSPRIAKIEVIRKSKVKRAKLYYLRERRGKSAKLKEKRRKAGAEVSTASEKIEAPPEEPKEEAKEQAVPETPAEKTEE